MIFKLIILFLFVLAGNAQAIDRYEPVTVSFTASESYSYPYADVTAYATVTKPDTTTFVMPLYWDGGSTWKLRVSGEAAGEYSYVTTCSGCTGDTGLHNKSGNFTIGSAYSATWAPHGFVTVDSSYPRYFKYSDGTRFLLTGDTWWDSFWDDLGWTTSFFQAAADERALQGFNYIQGVIWLDMTNGKLDSQHPCTGGDPDVINPAFFTLLDSRIQYLVQKGITVSILLGWADAFFYDNANFGVQVTRERLIQYVVARYSAYNILWAGVGEYDEYGTADQHLHTVNYIKSTDPYRHPITMHPAGTPSSAIRNAIDWYMTQRDGSGDWGYTDGQLGRTEAGSKPYVNGEYGYEDDSGGNQDGAEGVLQDLWGLMVGGSAGQVYGAFGVWQDEDSGDLELIGAETYIPAWKTFWNDSGVEYWLFNRFETPQPGLMLAARDGYQYVAWARTPNFFTLNLSASTGHALACKWFNARTGEFGTEFEETGGSSVSFMAPDTEDNKWVLLINDPQGGSGGTEGCNGNCYWVAGGGAASWAACKSDSDPGSGNYCSLSTANTSAYPGDIIFLKEGTYLISDASQANSVYPARSGTGVNARIIYSPAPGEGMPVLRCNDSPCNIHGIYLNNRQWIKVTGLQFEQFNPSYNIYILNHGSYNEIADCNLLDTSNYINFFCDGGGYTCPAKHNWVHGNYMEGSETHGGQCGEGNEILYLGGSSNYTGYKVENNTIEDNVFIHGGHSTMDSYNHLFSVIRNNKMRNDPFHNSPPPGETQCTTFASCPWLPVYTDSSLDYKWGHRCAQIGFNNDGSKTYSLVERNRFAYQSANPGNPGDANLTLAGAGTIARYNEMFGAMKMGLYFKYSWSRDYPYYGYGGINNRVYNNTVYHNGHGFEGGGCAANDRYNMVGTIYDDKHTGNILINNLFYDGKYGDMQISPYNLYCGSHCTLETAYDIRNNFCTSSGYGCTVYGQDPLFYSGGMPISSWAAWLENFETVPDLRLQPSSPAKDRGTHLTTATETQTDSAELKVADASFFQDGTWGSYLARASTNLGGSFVADCIAIGDPENSVCIQSIDYENNKIILATPKSWASGAHIYLYSDSYGTRVLYGQPDLGANEIAGEDTSYPQPLRYGPTGNVACGASSPADKTLFVETSEPADCALCPDTEAGCDEDATFDEVLEAGEAFATTGGTYHSIVKSLACGTEGSPAEYAYWYSCKDKAPIPNEMPAPVPSAFSIGAPEEAETGEPVLSDPQPAGDIGANQAAAVPLSVKATDDSGIAGVRYCQAGVDGCTSSTTYDEMIMTGAGDFDVVGGVPYADIIDSYSDAYQDYQGKLYGGFVTRNGNSFTVAPGILDKIAIKLDKVGNPTGTAVIKFYAETHATAYGVDSLPTGTALAQSDPLDVSTLTTASSEVTLNVSGSNRIDLTTLGAYGVWSLEYSGGDSLNYIRIGQDDSSPVHSGNGFYYINSLIVDTADLPFKLYVTRSSGGDFSKSLSLPAGACYTFYSRAEDNEGNSNSVSAVHSFCISSPTPAEWTEAESGEETGPMAEVSDATASGGKLIRSNTPEAGYATITINVDQEGDYRLNARTRVRDTGTNSFRIRVNDGDPVVWDINPSEDAACWNAWCIDTVKARGGGTPAAPEFNPWQVHLNAGENTIVVYGREEGAELDYLFPTRVTTSPVDPEPPAGLMIIGAHAPNLLIGKGAGNLTIR